MDFHGLAQKVRHKVWLLNTSVNISLTSERNNHLLTMPLDHRSLRNQQAMLDRVLRQQENKYHKKGNQETRRIKVINSIIIK